MDKLLTVREVAERLGVTYSRVSQFMATGRLKREKFESAVRIRESELNRFLAERAARNKPIPDALPEKAVAA